jgi:biotin carboxylase/glycosyltransferase involved in cell wall biosynthesis
MHRDLSTSLSIVVPCYRSGPWIEELVERIDRATRDLKGQRELILVDDASPDEETWPALHAVATRHDWIRALGLHFNVGQFRATLAGLARAEGEWVVTLDDDLQTPPEEISKLIAAAAENPEMEAIIGAYPVKQHSRLRNLGTHFVSWLYQKLFDQPRDFQTTSFRILRRGLVQVLCAHQTRRPQIGALILQTTTPARRMNVSVEHHPRPGGKSGYTWPTLINLALDNVFQSSVVPLRAVSVLGVSVALGSFFLSTYYFFRWLFGYIEQPGFTTLVLLQTFVAGMVLLSIGVVGEYVQRVVTEVTGQPHHKVRHEVGSAPFESAPGVRDGFGRLKLLVLGASQLQVPLVRAAVEMGIEVVTADNVPSNPAHAWAHESLDISTRDPEALIARARALGIGAVATAASDIAVPSAAAVIEALGLPGSPGAAAHVWTDKEAFRSFQSRAGLRHPGYVVGSETEALAAAARLQLAGPVVVKPIDRSGSRGIRMLESVDSDALLPALSLALAESFAGCAIVESQLAGSEHGGDGVVCGGDLRHFFLTRKRAVGPAVRGHVFPADVSPEVAARIHGEVQAHVTAVGFEDGIVDVDLRVDAEGRPTVIEMSPRIGGNGIPSLIRHATGLDLHRIAVETALGRAPAMVPTVRESGAAVHTLGSLVEGTVARLPEFAELRQEIPELVELEFDVVAGDRVRPFVDSSDQLGRALTEGGDPDELATRLDAALSRCVS